MAALVLVRCDLEPVEAAAAGLARLHTHYRAAVHSNLTQASLQLLEKAYELVAFPTCVSGQWDPWRSFGAIQDYYVLSEEEIRSVVEGTNAKYVPVNWDNYEGETEEAYEARIREGWKGDEAAIVLVREKEMRTWLEQKGEDAGKELPAVLVWEAGRVKQQWSSWEGWSQEEPKAVEVKEEKPSKPLSLPELLSSSLLSLTSHFSSQLSFALQASLQTLHPSSPDPLSSALQTAVIALAQLEEQTAVSLGHLEGKIKDVDRFKEEQERELKEMEESFREIREKQRQVEGLLSGLSESWQPTVSSLRSQLGSLKISQDSFSQELQSAQALLFPAFPLTFLSLTLTQSTLRITLHSRKYYPLYGYLVLYKDNVGIWNKQEYDVFQPAITTLEIPDLALYWESGQVEVGVVHFADGQRELVKRGKVRREGEYERSFLYETVGNVREVEERLGKTRGVEGLEVFRWLAVHWTNPSKPLLDPFLQCFLTSTKPLSQLQSFLESQGLTFAS